MGHNRRYDITARIAKFAPILFVAAPRHNLPNPQVLNSSHVRVTRACTCINTFISIQSRCSLIHDLIRSILMILGRAVISESRGASPFLFEKSFGNLSASCERVNLTTKITTADGVGADAARLGPLHENSQSLGTIENLLAARYSQCC